MNSASFAGIVDFCLRRRWLILLAALLVLAVSGVYVARNFALNTDINALLSPDLPWRKREAAFEEAFPQLVHSTIAVVSAPTPEFAGAAAASLVARLKPQTNAFHAVSAPEGDEFFTRNSLLYLPPDALSARLDKLRQAVPLIRVLASDQSLRGLSRALGMGLQGVAVHRFTLDTMAPTLDRVADTLEGVLAGKNATFSWQVLVNGAASREDLNRIIAIYPVLNYAALEPGQAAAAAIRKTAAAAHLDTQYGATVRLTGPIPLADAQFATLRQDVWINAIITAAIILIVLWLALRSVRIVLAVIITIFIGLAATAALGLLLVGAFNPISVAFAMLFVGLGADFAIQFSVRYRAQRHALHELAPSLVDGARYVGAPLTLAALAAAAGFLSFVPTNYRGVAELGLIAGVGMIVAYVGAMTLLPTLLDLLKPRPEPHPICQPRLARADRFLQRHRIAIVAATALVVLAASPSLAWLKFNFDPNGLQVPNTEAESTLRQLSGDPRISFESADVLTAPADAAAVAKRVAVLAEVGSTKTLDSFVPTEQRRKLAMIASAATAIEPALGEKPASPPSDADNVAALNGVVKALRDSAGEASGPGAGAANRLATDLQALATAQPNVRQQAQAAFIAPLTIDLQQIAQSLRPQEVTRANLPSDVVRQWQAPDGRVRTEIVPQGNAAESAAVGSFAQAVLAVVPNATGAAIEIYEWGKTVTDAFIKAGIIAICSIAVILFIALRRIRDVLVTLIPLWVAAAATLEICALSGFALNYANIIALPALLGVGVAFKIYYVTAWRRGEYNFLESTLTHAVFFSAVMTATAFGSLWFSAHPGISSMGKLLALSLACTLASAALFQPALMGPPRPAKTASDADSSRKTP